MVARVWSRTLNVVVVFLVASGVYMVVLLFVAVPIMMLPRGNQIAAQTVLAGVEVPAAFDLRTESGMGEVDYIQRSYIGKKRSYGVDAVDVPASFRLTRTDVDEDGSTQRGWRADQDGYTCDVDVTALSAPDDPFVFVPLRKGERERLADGELIILELYSICRQTGPGLTPFAWFRALVFGPVALTATWLFGRRTARTIRAVFVGRHIVARSAALVAGLTISTSGAIVLASLAFVIALVIHPGF